MQGVSSYLALSSQCRHFLCLARLAGVGCLRWSLLPITSYSPTKTPAYIHIALYCASQGRESCLRHQGLSLLNKPIRASPCILQMSPSWLSTETPSIPCPVQSPCTLSERLLKTMLSSLSCTPIRPIRRSFLCLVMVVSVSGEGSPSRGGGGGGLLPLG